MTGTWMMIGLAVANALMAQAFWPFWLRENEKASTKGEHVLSAALVFACFFGTIALAFYAGMMVPR